MLSHSSHKQSAKSLHPPGSARWGSAAASARSRAFWQHTASSCHATTCSLGASSRFSARRRAAVPRSSSSRRCFLARDRCAAASAVAAAPPPPPLRRRPGRRRVPGLAPLFSFPTSDALFDSPSPSPTGGGGVGAGWSGAAASERAGPGRRRGCGIGAGGARARLVRELGDGGAGFGIRFGVRGESRESQVECGKVRPACSRAMRANRSGRFGRVS